MKPIPRRHNHLDLFWMVMLAVLLFAGCDNSSTTGEGQVGAAVFRLEIKQPAAPAAPERFQSASASAANQIDCAGCGIEAINCKIYDAEGTIITEETFACSLHEGKIDNIPAGEDREIVVDAVGEDNILLYRGWIKGVSIPAWETTDLGVIELIDMGMENGLVAYYPFDGDANDESGNGMHGTVNGAVLTADRYGNENSAYSFDGADDYIVADATLLPTGERTVSLWFYTTIVTNRPVMLGYGGNSCGQSWFMGINHGGTKSYTMSGHCNANTINYDYPEEPVGAWYHFAITTDSSGTKIYVNGIEEQSNTIYVKNTYTDGKDLSLGVSVSPGGIAPYVDRNIGYFNGIMDEVRIYDRALSDQEIMALYDEKNSG